MTFSIELIATRAPIGRGRIRIDEFREEFETSLEFWSPADYRRQWSRALEGLVAGGDRSALITSITDPQTANFIFWWPLYRVDEDIVIQNGVLLLDELTGPFDPERCEAFVPEREQTGESGEQISEWRTSLAEIRDFLSTMPSPADRS